MSTRRLRPDRAFVDKRNGLLLARMMSPEVCGDTTHFVRRTAYAHGTGALGALVLTAVARVVLANE